MSTQIPRPSTPLFFDPKTGEINRIWFRFLEQNNEAVGSVSTLASGSIFIGDASNLPAAQAVSGDGTLSASGVLNVTASDTVAVANEATDTTCFVNFTTAASGNLPIKTNTGMTFNSSTGVVTFASSVLTTTDINGGTVDGTVIGGAARAAVSCTTLDANGNVVLGDNTADTLTIHPSAVTWQNAPTHSNNHIYSGSVSVQGGANPSVGTVSGHFLWEVSDIPGHTFIDSSRTANNRIIDFTWQTGVFYGRFAADNYGAVTPWVTVTGGHAAGISSILMPMLTVSGATALNGTVGLGDAAGDTITVTGTPAGQVIGTTYSPTRSAEANLDANVTMSQAQYMRVGATVTVSGAFTADPTAPGATSFEFTLPVASNIGAVEDVAGVAFAGGIAGQGAAISGSVANNTAVVSWIAVDVTSQAWSFTCVYQVI